MGPEATKVSGYVEIALGFKCLDCSEDKFSLELPTDQFYIQKQS